MAIAKLITQWFFAWLFYVLVSAVIILFVGAFLSWSLPNEWSSHGWGAFRGLMLVPMAVWGAATIVCAQRDLKKIKTMP